MGVSGDTKLYIESAITLIETIISTSGSEIIADLERIKYLYN